MTGNEKDNEAHSEHESDEPKKKPDLDDTISRLLRRKAVVNAEDGDDAEE